MSTTEVRLGFYIFGAILLQPFNLALLCKLQNFVEVVSGNLGQIHGLFLTLDGEFSDLLLFSVILIPIGIYCKILKKKSSDPLLLFTITY